MTNLCLQNLFNLTSANGNIVKQKPHHKIQQLGCRSSLQHSRTQKSPLQYLFHEWGNHMFAKEILSISHLVDGGIGAQTLAENVHVASFQALAEVSLQTVLQGACDVGYPLGYKATPILCWCL